MRKYQIQIRINSAATVCSLSPASSLYFSHSLLTTSNVLWLSCRQLREYDLLVRRGDSSHSRRTSESTESQGGETTEHKPTRNLRDSKRTNSPGRCRRYVRQFAAAAPIEVRTS